METKLSVKGTKIISNLAISLFGLVSLVFFLLAIDRTALIIVIAAAMLLASLYLMWKDQELDSVSLLIFFFGTTACFYFFTDVIGMASWPRAVAIAVFAALSLLLSNYLINSALPAINPDKAIYKIALAILFTELFWLLSFLNASPISKGAITAVMFFNLESIARDILSGKFQRGKFAFLGVVSIILLVIVIYRI
ncbi:MAG: hypothetical protein OEV37_04050 [Candidatus Berkelbacteria bacterium]|nr:hypothetical protein [Candidatus Berkelbacteria bacterium]